MKEILEDLFKDKNVNGFIISDELYQNLKDYITNLQEENKRLKQNQVKALNSIKDFIKSSKCEITEGYYSNDKHSQYWKMFKRFAEELQDKIKGIDTKDYVYIPKWREQELLNQEEQLDDYKSRNEKAIEYIHNNQPVFELSSKEQIQQWFEKEFYVNLLNILKGE